MSAGGLSGCRAAGGRAAWRGPVSSLRTQPPQALEPALTPAAPENADPRRGAPASLPEGPDDEPADWAALWACLQQAAAAAASQPPPVEAAGPRLAWSDAKGWSAQGCSAESAALFALYKPLLDARRRGRRCVVAQLGQSLDGFVATHSGDSYYVNGAACLSHLHRLRALADAVLVGAGTVAGDDPRLTTRRVPGAQPVRVVLDPRVRLDAAARVFSDGLAPSLWVCDARHAAQARASLGGGPAAGASGVEVLALEGWLDRSDAEALPHLLDALSARGLQRVFVEGGGITVSRFAAAGLLDRLHLIVAPVLIGDGRRGLSLPAAAAMRACPRPQARRLALGDDLVWDLDGRALGRRGLPQGGG